MKNLFCEKNLLESEDNVEKLFLDRLIRELGFKDSDIKTKESISKLTVGKGSKKEKYKPDYVLYKEKKPVIVIDAKSTKENVDDFIYQASGYSLSINQKYKKENPVKYFVLSNGMITKVFNWDEEKPILEIKFEEFNKENKNYEKLESILAYSVVSYEKKGEFEFKELPKNQVDGKFNACHNLIWKKEQISPTDAFYEFCKLFFIKLKQDKDIHQEYINKGIPISDIPSEEFKFSEQWIKKQDANNPINDILFKQRLLPFLKKEMEKGKKRIFEDNENINLNAGTIKEVVKELENIDFYGIDEDLNGRMFETFLSATVRGKDLGQFFTPRSVVEFMVEMADISVSKDIEKIETVFDGCCGSGGFLIDAMSNIVSKINKIQSLSDKEKESLKARVYNERIYGVEKSLKTCRVARMNLWFHGDGSSNVYCLDTLDKKFRYDESLNDERKEEIEEFKTKISEGLKFNVILTNPPFSTKYEWKKEDEKKILKDYDVSFKSLNKEKNERVSSLKSNVMFLERYYDYLDEKGKLLTIIDESVLNAEQDKVFRKYILDKFIVKAVISLPRNTFVNADTTTKTSILYLRKKTSVDEKQPPIFMAIVKNVGHSDSGKPEPHKSDLGKVLDEFKKFEK